MSKDRVSWAEMLDVLTDTDRRRNTILQKPSEIERMALFLLRREGFSAQLAPQTQKHFDLELYKPGERVAACVRNHRAKVHLGQIEKFLDFLAHENSANLTSGIFISSSGFTPSVYAYLREEKIANLRLAILRDNKLIWDCEKFDNAPEREKTTYIGVFTCKGGVGKTTISAHLAGAFGLNGYDVALLDLDRQQNLKKLLGEGVYLPATKGSVGSVISVLSHEDWDETAYHDTKIVVCDCNPEFDANPTDFIRNFDYCLIPTTLNPLGINKNADVIKRTFSQIRRVNQKAQLFVLINSLQRDEDNRNTLLNQVLKTQFKQLAERDSRVHYIDPAETAIRFSKQLMYWGFHLFDGTKPSFAFKTVGRYSYPRMDFLKLVDYLEMQTEIQKAKAVGRWQ
jgi:chromosome partitioning protein